MMKLLPKIGTLHGVCHIPPTSGIQTGYRQSLQELYYQYVEETQPDSNSSIFGVSQAA